MPDIVITIDTAGNLTRVVNAVCTHFGYQALLPGGGSNPESKNAFAKRMLAQWAKTITAEEEGRTAADAAQQTAVISANLIVIT